STRRSRRIRSNSSTRDGTPADLPTDRYGQEDHKQGGANIRADTPTPTTRQRTHPGGAKFHADSGLHRGQIR
ncbi:MAG: hypothetical protein LC749_19535, partial [Actinobacteria bacterium]|nr:hypothetical protein [Actinomycetota bacterium]